MLNIKKNGEGEKLTIELGGRLDTTTSPLLEKEYADCLNGVTELAFDFSELEYISSAGLRVLLAAQKIMNKQGAWLFAALQMKSRKYSMLQVSLIFLHLRTDCSNIKWGKKFID
jgi:Anti-anti-sigma regulatory factor (antagonist of anti-sigma factor)